MLRPVVCAILLLMLPAPAQNRSTEAQRLLASSAPADRAWGAWHAGQSGDNAWAQPLLRVWDAYATATGHEEQLARRAIADALGRIDVILAEPDMTKIARRLPDVALVMIGRHAERYADLLVEMLEYDLDDAMMTVVRSHVAKVRPPALALHLFSDLQIELLVHATDTEGQTFGGSGPMTTRSDSTLEVPPTFPPVTLHVWREPSATAAQLPATGPYYSQHEELTIKGGHSRDLGSVRRDDGDDRRLRFLAHLLKATPATLGVEARSHRAIVVGDRTQWPAAVDQARAGIDQALAGLRRQLLAAALLDRKTLQHATTRIAVRIEDHRADQSQPLPAHTATPDVVRIGSILWDTSFALAMQRARREQKPLLVHFGENPG